MDSHEIAYIAGLVDGEGSINLTKIDRAGKYGRPNATPLFNLRVSITNQHLETLEWIKAEFGGSLHRTTGAHVLIILTNVAERFLQTLKPYIRIKKPQLDLALMFQDLKQSRVHGRRKSDEEVYVYTKISEAMKMLNHRDSRAFHSNEGELLETLTHNGDGNQQPSPLNENIIVGGKVQRLTVEESQTNKTDTSALPETEDIVPHSSESWRS